MILSTTFTLYALAPQYLLLEAVSSQLHLNVPTSLFLTSHMVLGLMIAMGIGGLALLKKKEKMALGAPALRHKTQAFEQIKSLLTQAKNSNTIAPPKNKGSEIKELSPSENNVSEQSNTSALHMVSKK